VLLLEGNTPVFGATETSLFFWKHLFWREISTSKLSIMQEKQLHDSLSRLLSNGPRDYFGNVDEAYCNMSARVHSTFSPHSESYPTRAALVHMMQHEKQNQTSICLLASMRWGTLQAAT